MSEGSEELLVNIPLNPAQKAYVEARARRNYRPIRRELQMIVEESRQREEAAR